jgi:signal transduction histidine kinase
LRRPDGNRGNAMLSDFIASNRTDILGRVRMRVAARGESGVAEAGRPDGLPLFLEQLGEALRKASSFESASHDDIDRTAGLHGVDLFRQGLTVQQVVHDYGAVCQVITSLAVEQGAPIDATEFQTLNLCLDDAIAGAVSAFAQERERAISDEGTERLGILAHEMRNALNTAILSFTIIKKGMVGPAGSTSAIHERSLVRLNVLIDRSLAEVRLDAGMKNPERVAVWDLVAEVAIGASTLAQTRKLHYEVTPVDRRVHVNVDRQIVTAAISNLLQNAFKFTRPGSTVVLRTSASESRVFIEVEDECGGLGLADPESLLHPFVQRGADRSGLGLGLSICVKAMQASGGELRIRDLPGKGCSFTLSLERAP